MASRPRHVPLSSVVGWARKYPLAPRYRHAHHLTLRAADGVRLAAVALEGPPDPPAVAVLVHGFMHSSRTPSVHAFANRLAPHVPVVLPDLRGHGRSGGFSTVGHDEVLDVAAAVNAAAALWPDLPIVTIGVSLGGAAVLVHAGTIGCGTVAGVMAISAPASWASLDSERMQRLRKVTHSPLGRRIIAALARTRIVPTWAPPADPADAIGDIAPAWTVLVHDADDTYFGGDHAERLYQAAREPKELWWQPGGGHGSDLLTAALAERVVERVSGGSPAKR